MTIIQIEKMIEKIVCDAKTLTYHFDFVSATKYACTQLDAHKNDTLFLLHLSLVCEIESTDDNTNDCEFSFCMSAIAAHIETTLSRSDVQNA
jgi:hypothetical protein